ncbi:hypothetical protein CPB83DRAFT_909672 [Crepidotus variabilis]|uniref:Transmembrane protein n=1 Tax=Crepidotus variabilis TaxID=179855 RepID=A0A9P6E969_9AGAR|nr:hypothetical protein CPB83DRAFT_909672 [Crepidotus variabilis]
MATQVSIVDDTSSRIAYQGGSWFSYQGSAEKWPDFGPAYRNTLHGTEAPARFSFSFSGTSVEIFGPNDKDNYWECLIDNKQFASRDDYPSKEPGYNLLTFCKAPALQDGPHTLVVNVVAVKDKTFWFDRIQYTPSVNEPSASENAYVENFDPRLKFGNGRAPAKGNGDVTNARGSNFEFKFTGISVAWYSWIAPEYPGGPTTSTYYLDGGSARSFPLKGLANAVNLQRNQLIFETKLLPMGEHTLSVVYDGNDNATDTPLVLDYLVVRSGTSTDDSSPSTDSSSAPRSGSGSPLPTGTPSSFSKAAKAGIIAGCVVAVVVFCIPIAYLLLRQQRRRKKKNLTHAFPDFQTATTSVLSPFVSLPGPSSAFSVSKTSTQALGKRQGLRHHSSPETDDAAVVLHEDSGVRGLGNTQQDLVELPPQYTAG